MRTSRYLKLYALSKEDYSEKKHLKPGFTLTQYFCPKHLEFYLLNFAIYSPLMLWNKTQAKKERKKNHLCSINWVTEFGYHPNFFVNLSSYFRIVKFWYWRKPQRSWCLEKSSQVRLSSYFRICQNFFAPFFFFVLFHFLLAHCVAYLVSLPIFLFLCSSVWVYVLLPLGLFTL